MTSWRNKLDPRALIALDDEAGEFDVAVRLTDPEAVDDVARAGLQVHSAVGAIVAGRVRGADALRRVADLPCVAEVQLSRPMYDERRER